MKIFKNKKIMRTIALVLIVALTAGYLNESQNIQVQRYVSERAGTNEETSYKGQGAATKFGQLSEKLSEKLADMQETLDEDNASVIELADKAGELKRIVNASEKSLEKEFDLAEKKLAGINAKKAAGEFKTYRQSTEKKFAEFSKEISNVESKLSDNTVKISKTEIKQLSNELDKLAEVTQNKEPERELTDLSHNQVDVDTPKRVSGMQLPQSTIYENSLGKESNTGTQELDTPSLSDFDTDTETEMSEEMKSLVDELGTPVKIYEYIKNNIDFEPYYGSRKGAEGTFNQKSGNDYDQASLLIAMLRYKGYAARYVTGVVDVPVEKVMKWTGADTKTSAVKAMGSLGIPIAYTTKGGEINKVRMEHVWVSVYVAYDNYRGAGDITGRNIWLALDGSYKHYTKPEMLDFKEIIGISDEEIKEAFSGNSVAGEGTVTSADTTKLMNLGDKLEEKIETYFEENDISEDDEISSEEVKDMLGIKKIVKEDITLLPNSLPYTVVSTTSISSKITDEACDTISFSTEASFYESTFLGEADFEKEFKASELYGKKVTLSFAPATAEDEEIINSYGGIFNTPAYLINLVPELRIDGELAATGSKVRPGAYDRFTMVIDQAGQVSDVIENDLIAGGYYCVSFNYGKIDTVELDAIKSNIEAQKESLTDENLYTDDVMGEILNSVGKMYFGELDLYNSLIANILNVSATRQISEAVTGYLPATQYMFGMPVGVSDGTFYIDVDRNTMGVAGLDDIAETDRAYMIVSGAIGSSLEGIIFEQAMEQDAVSTMKVMELANAQGIPIVMIDSRNKDKIDGLNVSDTIKKEISTAVNCGKTVTVPQEEVDYGGWHGTGYVIMDTETGAASYMISGGTCGGSLVENIKVIIAFIADIVILMILLIEVMAGIYAMLGVVTSIPGMLLLAMSLLFLCYLEERVVNSVNTFEAYYKDQSHANASAVYLNLLNDTWMAAQCVILGQVFKSLGKLWEYGKSKNGGGSKPGGSTGGGTGEASTCLVKEGLGKISGKNYKITQKNIDKIKKHLDSNDMNALENTDMIKRLEEALKKGEKITGADASFYLHELKEASLMKGGKSYEAAHKSALEYYQVSPYSVYHPDVIKANGKWFSDAWFKFWDISR